MMQRVTRFPNRLYHFIWRNWDLLSDRRIASFLAVPVTTIRELAGDLGLGAQQDNLRRLRSRLRSLIIRRNWYLIPMAQIAQLVGMSSEQFEDFIVRDDMLSVKLPRKPRCARLHYRRPTEAQRKAAHSLVESVATLPKPSRPEQGYAFLDDLLIGRSCVKPPRLPSNEKWALAPRIMHPFDTPHNSSGLDLAYTPVAYLRLLKEFGADALWFPLVVYDLVRLPGYPEFGLEGREVLPRLRALMRRAKRAGLKTYFYITPPRSRPASFFRRHGELKGVRVRQYAPAGHYHVCLASAEGEKLVRDGMRELCRALPGVDGFVVITASEYPSHCHSHGYGAECERCGHRRPADAVAEIFRLMQEGIQQSGESAELVAWNWAWQWALNRGVADPNTHIFDMKIAPDARDYVIEKLPSDVLVLLMYEYGTRVRRGGAQNIVWEYTMSQTRQGPFAAAQKRAAEKTNRRALARIHISSTPEFMCVPYLPVMQLVAEKIRDLRTHKYVGYMGAWAFGGYPSPNMLIARELSRAGRRSISSVLRQVAALYYGKRNVDLVVQAWANFSKAFRNYPFSIPLQYSSWIHVAPAIAWHLKPSQSRSVMYTDNPEEYCAPYGPEAVYSSLQRVASGWKKGLECLAEAAQNTDGQQRPVAEQDYGVAESVFLCSRSLMNHIRFCGLRERSQHSRHAREELRKLIQSELALAKRYYYLLHLDSRLGFEAGMQYWVRPNDVAEKILGLQQLLSPRRSRKN